MRKILMGLLATVPLLATPAYAAVKTDNLSVTAKVLDSCSISSTQTLAFGDVDGNSDNIDNQGSLTFTCTDTTPYFVSAGTGANAVAGQRRMASQTLATTAYLTYDIYADRDRSITFPTAASETLDGSGETGGVGDGDAKTLTVYGRIPAGTHLPAPDDYLDTVVLTVTY
ncbi:spore coat protein U domain-containing protein [Sphingomonas sp. AP4-R1]|uniref:Csu type fimbrial protein n=1 Tax=Sphingomonas sp. AP4-R1 TaxID=2735134 RepID=UPI00149384D3|nr:spore coat U domain-containing protein [Sphingomonas sp. AP4-R1]QJU56990.1 spore coat protein U domain-containing protein [Sphingomonas sp. AP4-R1]